MAKNVTVKSYFVGTPKEVEKYGGQTPAHLKEREDKLSKEEKQSWAGLITPGTEMTVANDRAAELEKKGLVDVTSDGGEDEQENEAVKEKSEVKETEKLAPEKDYSKPVANVLVSDKQRKEKNESSNIPGDATAKNTGKK